MKIQNRYFLASLTSALILLIGLLGRFYFGDPTNSTDTLSSGMFILVGIVLFFSNGYKTVLWHSRARQFRNNFGVNPPSDPNMNWKVRLAIQPIVDEMLKSFAFLQDEAYKAENLIKDLDPGNLEEARLRHDDLMKGIPKVASVTKVFRDNSNLAYEWGFEIHHHYQNYLDKSCKDEKHKKQF